MSTPTLSDFLQFLEDTNTSFFLRDLFGNYIKRPGNKFQTTAFVDGIQVDYFPLGTTEFEEQEDLLEFAEDVLGKDVQQQFVAKKDSNAQNNFFLYDAQNTCNYAATMNSPLFVNQGFTGRLSLVRPDPCKKNKCSDICCKKFSYNASSLTLTQTSPAIYQISFSNANNILGNDQSGYLFFNNTNPLDQDTVFLFTFISLGNVNNQTLAQLKLYTNFFDNFLTIPAYIGKTLNFLSKGLSTKIQIHCSGENKCEKCIKMDNQKESIYL